MVFKRTNLFDSGIIVYDADYNGKRYRIVKSQDTGGDVWVLMRMYKNQYEKTCWSVPSNRRRSLTFFKRYMTEQIIKGNI